jgi:Insect cuticle protein
VQRKFDQSQAPSLHIGTIHDPLADPYEDPSYHFGFRLINQQRQETANRLGQVNGLYSYLDDVGESHLVRYAAGAGAGFNVLNSVPDSPASVQYNLPLYKAIVPTARGKIAFESGPNGQYK